MPQERQDGRQERVVAQPSLPHEGASVALQRREAALALPKRVSNRRGLQNCARMAGGGGASGSGAFGEFCVGAAP